jgi:hypothetical protein
MSTRARAYQRLPQAEVTATPTLAGLADAGHVGATNLDDDTDDRLDDVDDNDFDDDDEREALKKKAARSRAQQAAAWSNKLHAALWVLAAGTVAYAIDFFYVIFNDPRIKRCVLRW